MVLRILDDFLKRALPRTCQRKSNRVSQNDRASTFRTSSEDDMAIVSPQASVCVIYDSRTVAGCVYLNAPNSQDFERCRLLLGIRFLALNIRLRAWEGYR